MEPDPPHSPADEEIVGIRRGRAVLRIRVTPRSGRTGVELGAGHLAVRVRAPAERGRATEEALRAVAEWLGLPPTRLKLVAGETGRNKTVSIEGKDAADLRKLVAEKLDRGA